MSGEATETPQARTARLLRQQAEACGQIGSPLYDGLLRLAADDLLAGGPTLRVLEDHLADPGRNALALRMMGGVHALVLSGQAPELAKHYPSVTRGADPSAGHAWPAFRAVLADRGDEIRGWLERPPQTNEVGRAAALLGGLLHVSAEKPAPTRLVEIGASAGLNLHADRFRIDGEVGNYGDPSSPVQLGAAWRGIAPPRVPLNLAERYGGDLDPVDTTAEAGRLLLTAYVWPDQVARLERLRGAFEVAAASRVEVRAESAEETLRRTDLLDDGWTVVWHSVFQQYLSADTRVKLDAQLRRLGEAATERTRFAHLSLEPARRPGSADVEFLVTLTTWPGGEPRVLGAATPHGIPTAWER